MVKVEKNSSELSRLKSEGGSDVFSTSRHINPNAARSNYEFKLNFWSQDDSPIVRLLLKREPELMGTIYTQRYDGYGGIACEKITPMMARSAFHKVAIIASGVAFFALLVKFKGGSKTTRDSKL